MSTPFQERVYAACSEIPRGKVTTYALLGRHIGCKAARAIGQALRHNPRAPVVPCHRVIASDRRIGGFNGETSGSEIARKIQLLRDEGVRFDPDHRVTEACVWTFSG